MLVNLNDVLIPAKAGGYACQLQLVPLTGGFWHEYNSGNSEGAKGSGAAAFARC